MKSIILITILLFLDIDQSFQEPTFNAGGSGDIQLFIQNGQDPEIQVNWRGVDYDGEIQNREDLEDNTYITIRIGDMQGQIPCNNVVAYKRTLQEQNIQDKCVVIVIHGDDYIMDELENYTFDLMIFKYFPELERLFKTNQIETRSFQVQVSLRVDVYPKHHITNYNGPSPISVHYNKLQTELTYKRNGEVPTIDPELEEEAGDQESKGFLFWLFIFLCVGLVVFWNKISSYYKDNQGRFYSNNEEAEILQGQGVQMQVINKA